MRIKVIIPNAGMDAETLRAREQMLAGVARPDTEISVDCIAAGPESLESHYDEVMASPYTLDKVKEAATDGFDAIVIYCTSDVAVDAAREIVDIPVIGPGETALHLAAMLGNSVSYLVVLEETIPGAVERFRKSKVGGLRLASLRSLGIPVANLRGDMAATTAAVIHAGRRAIEEDGADVLILDCMGFAGVGQAAQAALGAPVIDPAFVAVNMAELLALSGLAHSRRAWPTPPEKTYFDAAEA